MEAPALLPKHLLPLLEVEKEIQLFQNLKRNLLHMTEFLETAALDQTWTMNHPDFYQTLFLYLTRRYKQGRLDRSLISRIILAIQSNPSMLLAILPKDLSLNVDGKKVKVNSLLFDVQNRQWLMNDFTKEQFSIIQEYIETGGVERLFEKQEESVENLLKIVSRYGVTDLATHLEKHLVRYITTENALEKLKAAYKNNQPILLEKAGSLIEEITITSECPGHLKARWKRVNSKSLAIFQELSSYITELALHDPSMTEYLPMFKGLQALDLSELTSAPNISEEVRRKILKLNVQATPWLEREWLLQFINLQSLNLSQNPYLDYSFWSCLSSLSFLEEIDLSGNTQIDDQQLSIILLAAAEIRMLSLEGCKQISPEGLSTIGSHLKALVQLNLSRTNLTDPALASITSQARRLKHLDIAKCPSVSEFTKRKVQNLLNHL